MSRSLKYDKKDFCNRKWHFAVISCILFSLCVFVTSCGNESITCVIDAVEISSLRSEGIFSEGDKKPNVTDKNDAKITEKAEERTEEEAKTRVETTSETIDTHDAAVVEAETDAVITYVLNKSTKRFHLQGCSSAKKMNDENKDIYEGKRSDLINMGYVPCGNCHP